MIQIIFTMKVIFLEYQILLFFFISFLDIRKAVVLLSLIYCTSYCLCVCVWGGGGGSMFVFVSVCITFCHF